MNINRVIQVDNGQTLQALHRFLNLFWRKYHLDALLAPIENPAINRGAIGGMATRAITDPTLLHQVNPFAPVMPESAACLVSDFIKAQQNGQAQLRKRLAVLLRPCELRALIELHKQKRLPAEIEDVVIIGVDCLGTFRRDEFQNRLEQESLTQLTNEVFRIASAGNINENRISLRTGVLQQTYRTACQICDWPAPRGAHITIGTIGVATDRYLMLIAPDEITDDRLSLGEVANKFASEYQVSHRETVVGAIGDARNNLRQKMLSDLQSENRFKDLASLLVLFNNCTVCGECLKHCPIENGDLNNLFVDRQPIQNGTTVPELRFRRHTPLADLVAISHWLASCSGCGMCEQTCEHDVPLTLLISALSHRIRAEVHYQAGDPNQNLPWERVKL